MSYVSSSLFRLLFACILVFTSLSTNAQLRLPAIIGSNMVLQQDEEVTLWGWDTPGQQIWISKSWGNATSIGEANENGEWKAIIRTPITGYGPHWIKISGSEQIILKNVLMGEVWLCSGQSNMEMPLKGWSGQPITGSTDAIASANYPEIRLFTVTRKTTYEPVDDCEGSWAECTSESAPDFSATGYFFGLELYKKLGIPIGLIHSSWGGTPAEAWTSKEYIGQIPFFQNTPGENKPMEYRQKKLDAHKIVQDKWLASLGFFPDEKNPPEWALPEYEDKNWIKVSVPEKWENTSLGNYKGMAEFRVKFKVPKKLVGKALVLELGPIDEIDITWVNGVNVGSHPNPYSWNTPRVYTIPEGVIKKGQNTLAIQIGNTSGAGGIYGQTDQVRIYPEDAEDDFKVIKGKWLARKSKSYGEVVPMPWCDNCGDPGTPTTLYNGMINPLIPFRIKGAIWYQGESNRYDGKLYGKIFPNMINSWRDNWGQGDFPFYYVQIAPYTYRDQLSTGLLRESQHNAMLLPYTGMVVTMDIGDMVTIHPPDKENVGKRLAYWALAKDYKQNIAFSGPLYKEFKPEENKIRISFEHVGDGLITDGSDLKHFLIAGRDREFVPANAVIEGNTVVVSSPEVENPIAVRFGWGSTDETNLFNKAGLPAGPFRTDRWKD